MSKCQSCNKKPSFNVKGQPPLFCAAHKTDEMMNVTRVLCEFQDCSTAAIFGYLDHPSQRCKAHKLASMVNHSYTYCAHKGCSTMASYGPPNTKATVCAKHKKPGMIPSKSRMCNYPDCKVQNPCFHHPGNKPGIRCSAHMEPGMVDVMHSRCEHDTCSLQPSYDMPGGKGRFCTTHKLPGMIDIKNPYCDYAGCAVVNPVFNNPGEKKGKFCVLHKSPGMIDVKHNVCEADSCTTRPIYNTKGEKKGRFCSTHKLPGMIDVSHKVCEYEDCAIRPTYDMKGGKGRRCKAHMLPGMIDIANKPCEVENCLIRARYGRPGHAKVRCTEHRETGMIAFPGAKCTICKQPATWGTVTNLLHCEEHKEDGEKNMVERPCNSCNLLSLLDDNGRCEDCHPESFVRAALYKQNSLMSYLDIRGLHGTTTDKRIDDGSCGKERPDRLFELDDKIIILECDEHQHNDRTCLCEQTRMINIGQSLGGIPVYFIRFNPDTYQSLDKTPEPLLRRYQLCGDFIQNIIDHSVSLPAALVACIYLYFDKWDGFHNEQWNIITPFDT